MVRKPKEGRAGRIIVYCSDCGDYFMSDGKFGWKCPNCGMFLSTLKCCRCGHEWVPKSFAEMPKVCAACKSPYWNREKVNRRNTE